MEESNIQAKVLEILKKYTKDADLWADANLETDILGGLDINSSRFVDIVMDVEDEFQIELDDEVVDKMNTIQDVIDAVKGKVS